MIDSKVLMFDTTYQKSTPLKSPIKKPKLNHVGIMNSDKSNR